MQAAKEKMSNMASVAKEHAKVYKAKVDEKAEMAKARSSGDKEIAHERRKAKEAAASMELHADKARHKAQTLDAKHNHTLNPVTGHHDTHGHRNPITGHNDAYGGHWAQRTQSLDWYAHYYYTRNGSSSFRAPPSYQQVSMKLI